MQVLNFYDHFNSFYGGLWFKIVDDMMMLDNISWEFTVLWYQMMSIYKWKVQFKQRGSGRYAAVFEQIEQIHEIGQIHRQSTATTQWELPYTGKQWMDFFTKGGSKMFWFPLKDRTTLKSMRSTIYASDILCI